MCVTPNGKRAPRTLAASNPSQVTAKTASLLSQGLRGNSKPVNMSSSASTSNLRTLMKPTVQSTPVARGLKPETKKPRRRRRRKPQKPGKTAKQNDRHFVVHNYHDHAQDVSENDLQDIPTPRRRGGASLSFPTKLHAILDQVEEDGLSHVLSWQPHGRCFVIHKPKDFVDHVMPKYFRQTKITSFQRQLNLYGFSRLTIGKDNGGYYHELFLRGKVFLAAKMSRTKIKGTKFKAASSPDQEPDFYSMEPMTLTATPPASHESSVDGGGRERRNRPAAISQTPSMPQVTLPNIMVLPAQTPLLLTGNPYMNYQHHQQLIRGTPPQMQQPVTLTVTPPASDESSADDGSQELHNYPTAISQSTSMPQLTLPNIMMLPAQTPLLLTGNPYINYQHHRQLVQGTPPQIQEPVTLKTTPPTSDESSADDGNHERRNYPAAMPQSTSMPQVALPNIMVMSTQVPLILTGNPHAKYQHQQQPPPQMQGVLCANCEAMPNIPSCVAVNSGNGADNAFDVAIDEIFEETTQDNLNMAEDFSSIWDPNAEIPGSIDDDQQLGNIFDQLMSEL